MEPQTQIKGTGSYERGGNGICVLCAEVTAIPGEMYCRECIKEKLPQKESKVPPDVAFRQKLDNYCDKYNLPRVPHPTATQMEIPSTSKPEKKYVIRMVPDGSYRCSCPDFVFRGDLKGTCKHIIEHVESYRERREKANL